MLSVSDRTAAANKPMNLALPEATGGNAPLSYALSGLPSTLTFDEAARTVSGTPGSSDVGDHALTLRGDGQRRRHGRSEFHAHDRDGRGGGSCRACRTRRGLRAWR